MKNNSLFKKVVIGMVVLGLGASLVCFRGSLKANASSNKSCTETFNRSVDKVQDMTEDEFNATFDNEEYAREFSKTYCTKVTRDGSNSDLAIELLVNLTSDQANELIDKIYNKLPSFVQKIVGRERINELVVEFIQYLKDNEDVQNKVDEYIKYMSEKTKISENIIKVVVEFSFKYVEELFNTDNVTPTEQPTVEPVVTIEPTVEPTAEITVEPTVVPAA